MSTHPGVSVEFKKHSRNCYADLR